MPEALLSVLANNKGIIANNIESKTSELPFLVSTAVLLSPHPHPGWLAVHHCILGAGQCLAHSRCSICTC